MSTADASNFYLDFWPFLSGLETKVHQCGAQLYLFELKSCSVEGGLQNKKI